MRREGQAPPLRNSPISSSPRRGSLEQRADTRGRPYREGEISWGGRVRTPAPTEGNEPGTLIRTTQAQKRNRTGHNFSFAQAPSGAGRNRTQALLILRAGRAAQCSRDSPRNGVRGKATMSTKCSSGAVPGGVLVTLPPRAKSLAARRRRNPPRKTPEAAKSPAKTINETPPSSVPRVSPPPGGQTGGIPPPSPP